MWGIDAETAVWPWTDTRSVSIGCQGSVSSIMNCIPCAFSELAIGGSLAGVFNSKKSGALDCSDSSNKGSIRARGGGSNSDGFGSTGGDHSAILLVEGTEIPVDSSRSGSLSCFTGRRVVWGRSHDV